MKKTIAIRILAIMMFVALLIVPGMALADGGGTAATPEQATLADAAIKLAVQIIGTVIVTAIGIAGTWATMQLGKSKKLQNITQATLDASRLAAETVPVLQADLVDELKQANSDGKLTKEEIAMITDKLIEKTRQKMSAVAYNLLAAAAVDVNTVIVDAGKRAVEELKKKQPAA